MMLIESLDWNRTTSSSFTTTSCGRRPKYFAWHRDLSTGPRKRMSTASPSSCKRSSSGRRHSFLTLIHHSVRNYYFFFHGIFSLRHDYGPVAWTLLNFKWHLRWDCITHYVIWTTFCMRFTNEMRKTSTYHHSVRKTHTKWRSRWSNA